MNGFLRPAILAVVLAAVLATACQRSQSAVGDRVGVVATFYPLAEFARRIGGDRIDVRTLVPAGVESHDYEPTPKDIAAVTQARLFVYNGAGFEPWVDRVLPDLPMSVLQINATEGLPLESPPWYSGGVDPHVWLDPVLAKAQVDRIRDGLARADPAGVAAYQAGAQQLRAELDALHRRYAEVLRTCRRKEFVTSHAAFGYLAARYGLTQVAIAGIDPEAEPSPARLLEAVKFMRRSGAKVVYAETLTESRVAEVVAREAGAQVKVLNPIEGLTREQQSRGLDYMTLMYDNLRQLAEGLDCSR